MKILKMILILVWVPALLLLSACGDSDSTHVASWSEAALVADNAPNPQVATDGNGNLIGVWAELDGVYCNRFTNGIGWGSPQKISDLSSYWVIPQIALSPDGQFAAVWYNDPALVGFDVTIIKVNPGAGYSLENKLSLRGLIGDLAIDNNGNVFIATEEPSVDLEGLIKLTIYHYNQADGWSHEPIATTGSFGRIVRIAVDGSGNGFVMWSQISSNSYKLFVRGFAKDKIVDSIQLAETTEMGFDWINIAMDNDGNAATLWGMVDSNSTPHTYTSSYSMVDGWSKAKQIDDASTASIEQSMTVDHAGNCYAIWRRITDSNNSDIYSCKYTPSGGWQTPKFVGSGGGMVARFPRIAVDSHGNLFATWLQYDPNGIDQRFGGDGKVCANYCPSGADWGEQHLLSASPGDAGNPAVAVDGSGSAMVIWSQSTGSVDGIISYGTFFSRFE